MLISIILLWAVVVIEFIFIISLFGKCIANEKTIEEIVKFLDEYVKKSGESREKMVDTIDRLADKVIEIYEWKERAWTTQKR